MKKARQCSEYENVWKRYILIRVGFIPYPREHKRIIIEQISK